MDLKSIAEKVTNHPVTWVVNSHWHGDHIRGNQSFRESTIVSSEITYKKMKENHPSRISKQKKDLHGLANYIRSLQESNDNELKDQINFLKEIEKSLPTLELVLPHRTFNTDLTFSGTRCSAKLFTLGGGHSFCDAMLFIPEERVIFMGDLLFVQCHPTFFEEESNLSNWVEALREVKLLDFDTAIPGHGPVGTKQDFQKLINYISEVQNLASKNKKIEDIEIPAKYRDWASPEVFQQNIKFIKQESNSKTIS